MSFPDSSIVDVKTIVSPIPTDLRSTNAKLFCEMLEPLKDKMLALLIQLPPSYQIKEGLQDFISSGVKKFYTTSR